jgi:hypothetical protein
MDNDVMKRAFVLILILMTSCSMLYFKYSAIGAKGDSIYPVHNLNTGLNYTTIQEAINANETKNGHTILVDAGIYYEAVSVNKSISLIGADRNATILDGNFTIYSLINITASNTKVSNFTFMRSTFGIWWSNGSNIEVSDNVFTQMSWAGVYAGKVTLIGVYSQSNGRIINNFMENNASHIFVDGGNNVTIVGNTMIQSIYAALTLTSAGSTQPNIFWSNNFINNNSSIFNYESVTYLNSDYPVGGNYWSDYKGTDKYSGPYQNESGSDGIGDTPYIPSHSPYDTSNPVDYYPLMHPIPEFPLFFIPPLFLITTLLATTIYRKRMKRS